MDVKQRPSAEARTIGAGVVSLITAAQRRYWTDNGYLVLNHAVTDAPGWADALETAEVGARQVLLDQLSACRLDQTIEALLGKQVVILASRYISQTWVQPFRQDAWTLPGIDPEACVAACICLATDDETASSYLVPGSHRVTGNSSGVPDPMSGAERLSGWLGRQSSAPEVLCLRSGDIWLRHPLLMHGRVEAPSASVGRRLEITYLAAGALPPRLIVDDRDSSLRMSSGCLETAVGFDGDRQSSSRKSFATSP